MLDLDSLAAGRAKSLNQQEQPWLDFVWSPEFQKISSHMSDGEVEKFIDMCLSVANLKSVILFLDKNSEERKVPPFTLLTEEAKKAGVEPSAWIASFAGNGR